MRRYKNDGQSHSNSFTRCGRVFEPMHTLGLANLRGRDWISECKSKGSVEQPPKLDELEC